MNEQVTKSNKSTPSVSFLMVVRKESIYLYDCLISIKNQSFEDWNLVIVLDRDDGSNETQIRKLIDSSRLVILHDNFLTSGLSQMLNRGLEHCTGTFIARIDDDDVCHRDRLFIQMNEMSQNPSCDVCFSSATLINAQSENIGRIDAPKVLSNFHEQMLRRNLIVNSTSFIRRNVLIENRGYKQCVNPVEDYLLWLSLLPNRNFLAINESLVSYRLYESNFSRVALNSKIITELKRARIKLAMESNIPRRKAIFNHYLWVLEYNIGRLLYRVRNLNQKL